MTVPIQRRTSSPQLPRAAVAAVVRRPDLWWAALGALVRLAAPGWWRRPPRLPLPDPDLWSFRMVTAYGRPDAVPTDDDLVSYLEWCRSTAMGRHPFGRGRQGPDRTNNLVGRQSG